MGISATWKDGPKRWEVTLRRDGMKKGRLAPVGMGKREAVKEIGDQLIREFETTKTVPAAAPLTLWEFCASVYVARHGLTERTWRNRSYKVAGVMADLGHLALPAVTTRVVQDWLTLLQSNGAPLKKGGRGKPLAAGGDALNDYLVTLKAIYRVAVDHGDILAVPFKAKLIPILLATDRTAWTADMKARLVEKAAEMDPGIHRLAEFLMLTGCRPVEALRLRWSDVHDLPRPHLTLDGKGHRFRKLPINGPLAELLAGLPRAGASDAVFPVEYGATAGEGYQFWPQRRWEAVCKAAEVPSAAYDLRHTFITEMVVRNVPMAKVAKWCGNSVRVIEERYSHLSHDFLHEVSDQVVGPGRAQVQVPVASLVSMPVGDVEDIDELEDLDEVEWPV